VIANTATAVNLYTVVRRARPRLKDHQQKPYHVNRRKSHADSGSKAENADMEMIVFFGMVTAMLSRRAVAPRRKMGSSQAKEQAK
jgi:hypothetical protein